MKTTFIFFMSIALFATPFFSAHAQQDAPPVKILPTTQHGVIKVLYASDATQPVEVSFYNDNGIIAFDKIDGNYPNGLSKKYDVSQITSRQYWIEVKSDRMTVLYRVASARATVFDSQLEKITYHHPMVAAK